jgi:hypothetical protein
LRAELEPFGKCYSGPVRPENGPVGTISQPVKFRQIPVVSGEKRTGWNYFSTGEIPANSGNFRRKNGKLLRQFLEKKWTWSQHYTNVKDTRKLRNKIVRSKQNKRVMR